MPKTESLDELIAQRAAEFADQIKAAAVMADKEEEIRIEVEKQLAFIQKDAGVKLEGRHEFTVAQGRADSVYQRVIIEYKNPKSPGARIGPKGDSAGTKKVVEQLKNRFYDMQSELGHPLNSIFGVGLDGNYFVFVRYRDNKWQVQEPVEVNKYSAERFLWALYNLGQKGKPFSSEYLAGDFGSDSPLAQNGVRALYEAISTTDHPKAQVFFNQWKILFGEVCGYDVDNPSDKIKKLAEFYGIVHRRKLRPAELLFAVHSYYAIFMKLLASEIAAYFHKLPTPLQKMIQAGSSKALKREMEDLELGSIFRHLNITNFLEGDLFAWYTSVWSEPIELLVRGMVARLDDYNPGTLSEEPASSRDLLKKLYHQLFPKSVRHDLGEYYTPDWLAEHVLNELGYVGDPDKRLLDPACGSGTFLVMAINQIREWYDQHREKVRFDEGDLCRKILSNVIGFDLNPLAVLAARTNYLIAIRDLIGHTDKVEIPIYLCDSIMTPSEYGDLFSGGVLGRAKELSTAAAKFIIPIEIATNREQVARYAEQLEFCVRNGYSPEEFVERCCEEGLPLTENALHTELFNELVRLDKANKNGVWARIIKNSFAPLFTEKVDYVAGNPPWVNWSNLPNDYRSSTGPIWQHYNLFPHTGLRARSGSAMDDISVLLTYVSLDVYTKPHGLLGFVITQSVFKTEGGGEGFRRFELSQGKPLNVKSVCDMTSLQPFEGAINRTATMVIQKGAPTKYPVPYFIWRPVAKIDQTLSLMEVREHVAVVKKVARPVSPHKITSPWITGTVDELSAITKCFGASAYQGRYGTHCHASGIYWVSVLGKPSRQKVLIQNLGDVGKTKFPSIEHRVDAQFVHPLARGRDVDKWSINPRCSMILPQDKHNPAKAVAESLLRQKFPDTFGYLKEFEKSLRARTGYRKFFRPGIDPFYSVYNVGDYTFSKFKVLWREVANDLRAAVSDGGNDIVIPDHTLVSVATESSDEAHYLCGMLNTSLSNYIVTNYVAGHPAPHILKYIRIERYRHDNPEHRQIVALSRECHRATAESEYEVVQDLEKQVDEVAAKIWKLTDSEVRAIQESL